MSEYLFDDFRPPRDTENKDWPVKNAGSPFQPMLRGDLPFGSFRRVPENKRSSQRDGSRDGTNWSQFLDLNTIDENMQEHLKCLPPIPAGETLRLYRRLPFGHMLTHAGYQVCCSETGAGLLADISVVSVDDTSTVLADIATGVDLGSQAMEGIAIEPATGGLFLPQENMGYLCVSITPPYTDADGNGYFADDCNDVPCITLQVRVNMIDLCFTHMAYGCYKGCGCISFIPEECPEDEQGGGEKQP